jgi:hypothetical protein
MIHLWQPDFIITTGDNNYGRLTPEVGDWEPFIGHYYGRYMLGRTDGRYPYQTSDVQRFFPSVGNHDTGIEFGDAPLPDDGGDQGGGPQETGTVGEARDGYLDYFHLDPGRPGGRLPPGVHAADTSYYDFEWGPLHMFAIDAEAAFLVPEQMAEQQAWLQQQLAASTSPWQIVYLHFPPFSSGPHGSHSSLQWPFAEWGADAVLAGHDHTYERLSAVGMLHIVTGLGGQVPYPFRDPPAPESVFRFNERHGALRVTASETNLRFEFVAIPITPEDNPMGETIDVFEMSVPVPEPSGAGLAWAVAAIIGWFGRRR